MRRVSIMYHMHIDHSKPSDDYPHKIESVETCITLPMRDEVAEDLLKNGAESRYLCSMGEVRLILERISELQGYYYSGVCFIEEELREDSEKKILSPNEYLKMVIGKDIKIAGNNPVEEIENILDEHFGEGSYWSYPVEEKDYCEQEGLSVVLVDVSYYDGFNFIKSLRYFEADSESNKEED